MKIIEAVSSVSVKVNLGDYQSIDFFTSIKAEVGDGELLAVVNASLHRVATAATLAKLRAHFAARGKKMSDESLAKLYGLKIIPDKPPEDFG